MSTSLRKGIWGNCILFRFRFGIIDDSDYICTSIKFRVYEDMEAARMVESVDTRDLKSLGQRCPYGFDSRSEYKNDLIFKRSS